MTFDMAPTILSLAGVRHNYPFPLGEDLTKPESLNPNRLRADRIHPNIVSQTFDNLCEMVLSIRQGQSETLADRLGKYEGITIEVIGYK